MKKSVVSVVMSLLLAVCMAASGILPVLYTSATENDVAAVALRQDLTESPQGAVDLSWDAAEGAARYDLYVYETDGWEIAGSETTETTKRIESLPNAAALFFRLQAVDADGKLIAASDVLTAYTVPSAPALEDAFIDGENCTVSWKAVDGADGYILYANDETRIAETQKTEISFSADLLKQAQIGISTYQYINGIACESAVRSCALTVNTEKKESLTLGLGETADLSYLAFGETAYRSADAQTVSVDENGLATAEKLGRTQILVTTEAGMRPVNVTVLAAPQTVAFTESQVNMTVGEIRETGLDLSGAGALSRIYKSDNTAVVTVDNNGILTAHKAGTAIIRVTLYNGVTAQVSVTVSQTQTLQFDKPTLKLGVGEKSKNIVLSGGERAVNVRYDGFGDVLRIASNGTFIALNAGIVEVTATTTDGRTAICTVTVVEEPQELRLSKEHSELGVGAVLILQAQADTDVVLENIQWSSDDEAVVTVESGIVTAVGVGEATVTATLYNGVEATCYITVLAAPKKLSLNANTYTIYEGKTHKLTAFAEVDAYLGTLSFESSAPSVLTVDAEGNVKALKAGKAVVTVTAYNGISAKCVYTVLAEATKVTVTSSAMTFAVGMYSRMTAKTDTGSGLDGAVWEVSDESIAVLNDAHQLIARKAGKVTVTVTLANGVKGSCTVTIQAAPTFVSLNKTNLTLDVNTRERLTASVNSGAYSKGITFSSSNDAVARVAADGTVIAVAPGTATVTAKTFNGKTATCTVTVGALPTSISFGYSTYTQTQGSWFYVTVYNENDEKYNGATFTSSDTSIATVAADGLVHVKKMGTATITARSSNGLTATTRVYVTRMQVTLVSQLPDYPTGCEAASCAMLLRYYGYYYSTADMVDIIPRQNIYYINGYPIGPDINESFVGDPTCTYTSANPGYGVFSPAVTKALQTAVDYAGGDETAVCITGCTYSELLGYLADGYPVIVWSTYNMNVPTTVNEWYIIEDDGSWRYFSYPRGTHVTVLCGYDGSYIYMMDPYDNACLSFSSSTFKARWDLLGNQGVILK